MRGLNSGLLNKRSIQAGMKRVTSIDGLRAISVTLVIYFHAFFLNTFKLDRAEIPAQIHSVPPWLDWVWHGEKGVDVFFVISGFLICTLLLQEHATRGSVSLRAFYIKRFFRIVPAYALLILVGLAADWPNARQFGWNLLFINNHAELGEAFLPWAWSIAVEMQFYLLFPFLFIFFKGRIKRLAAFVIAMIVVVLAARLMLLLNEPVLYETPFYELMFARPALRARWFDLLYFDLWARSVPILLGILAALIYSHWQQWFKEAGSSFLAMLLSGLLLVLVVSYIPVYDVNSWYGVHFDSSINLIILAFSRALFSLGVVLILLASLMEMRGKNPVHLFLSSSLLRPVADASYSMYLFHIPLLIMITSLLKRGATDQDNWELFFHAAWMTFLLSLLFGLIVQRWIERPGIIYSHKLVKRLK